MIAAACAGDKQRRTGRQAGRYDRRGDRRQARAGRCRPTWRSSPQPAKPADGFRRRRRDVRRRRRPPASPPSQPTGEFVSPSRSEVAPKQPGRVAAVYVDAGSRVSRGQPLLTLETDYSRIDVQRAQADLARAKAAEDDARRDFERKKGLLGNQSIPQATYDRSQSAYEQAQAARASAEASLSLARQHVARRRDALADRPA